LKPHNSLKIRTAPWGGREKAQHAKKEGGTCQTEPEPSYFDLFLMGCNAFGHRDQRSNPTKGLKKSLSEKGGGGSRRAAGSSGEITIRKLRIISPTKRDYFPKLTITLVQRRGEDAVKRRRVGTKITPAEEKGKNQSSHEKLSNEKNVSTNAKWV